MGEPNRVPALALIVAMLLAPIAVALVVTLLVAAASGQAGLSGGLQVWSRLSLFGSGCALVFGVPPALAMLRAPALPIGPWLAVGLLSGLLSALAVILAIGSLRWLDAPASFLPLVALLAGLHLLIATLVARLSLQRYRARRRW